MTDAPGQDFDWFRFIELSDAIESRDYPALTEALRNGADVNYVTVPPEMYGYNPLSHAAIIGDPTLIAVLVHAGADPNRQNPDGSTALTSARDTKSIKTLLVAGARVALETPACGYTSVHEAAYDNDIDRLRLLIDEGDGSTAFNRFDEVKNTPLIAAASKGNVEAVNFLINRGADVNAVYVEEDGWGFTALEKAANDEVLQVLLAAGADPNIDAFSPHPPRHHDFLQKPRQEETGPSAVPEPPRHRNRGRRRAR